MKNLSKPNKLIFSRKQAIQMFGRPSSNRTYFLDANTHAHTHPSSIHFSTNIRCCRFYQKSQHIPWFLACKLLHVKLVESALWNSKKLHRLLKFHNIQIKSIFHIVMMLMPSKTDLQTYILPCFKQLSHWIGMSKQFSIVLRLKSWNGCHNQSMEFWLKLNRARKHFLLVPFQMSYSIAFAFNFY